MVGALSGWSALSNFAVGISTHWGHQILGGAPAEEGVWRQSCLMDTIAGSFGVRGDCIVKSGEKGARYVTFILDTHEIDFVKKIRQSMKKYSSIQPFFFRDHRKASTFFEWNWGKTLK